MLLREAKKIIRKFGYKIIKEEIDPEIEASENKARFFRQPNRLKRAFTGIEMKDPDDSPMTEEEFCSIVENKVKGLAKLYHIDIDKRQLKQLCLNAFDEEMSVNKAFKYIWKIVSE